MAGYVVYRAEGTAGGPYTLMPPTFVPHSPWPWQPGFDDYDVAPGAVYYYVVTAVDFTGNESAFSSIFTVSLPADTTPPVITITSPANNDGTVNPWPIIRAQVTEDLIGIDTWTWPLSAGAGFRIVLDGADLTSLLESYATIGATEQTVGWAYTLNITTSYVQGSPAVVGTPLENGLAEGPHAMEIRLRDVADNEGSGTSSFYMQPVTVVLDALSARHEALGWQPTPMDSEIAAIRQSIEDMLPFFVDPQTGTPWTSIGELLQAALGRTTWESPVSFFQKILDIKRVLNCLRWQPLFLPSEGKGLLVQKAETRWPV